MDDEFVFTTFTSETMLSDLQKINESKRFFSHPYKTSSTHKNSDPYFQII